MIWHEGKVQEREEVLGANEAKPFRQIGMHPVRDKVAPVRPEDQELSPLATNTQKVQVKGVGREKGLGDGGQIKLPHPVFSQSQPGGARTLRLFI